MTTTTHSHKAWTDKGGTRQVCLNQRPRLLEGRPSRLSHCITREALLQAELQGLRFLLRREPSLGFGGVRHQWTVWWSWRDPIDLSLKTGEARGYSF